MRSIIYFLLTISVPASAKLNVVTTTPDLAAMVKRVAGDKVQVTAIAKGVQDVHQIEVKPSFMVLLRDADLVLAHGLELESAWLEPLIQGARNPKIVLSSRGYFAVAPLLHPIGVRTGPISRAEGDIHASGNPHFQLDPVRIASAGELIANRLAELDKINGKFYQTQARQWTAQLQTQMAAWQARVTKSGIKEIVTYHKTFDYFCERFKIKCLLQLEPRPGIPPTASHLISIVRDIKDRKIPIVLIENYYDIEVAEKLRSEVPSLKVLQVPVAVGGAERITTNEELLESLVSVFDGAKD